MGMITLDISTACGYNFRKEHYLVLLNPLLGDWDPVVDRNCFMKAIPIEPLIGGLRPYWSAMRTTSTRYWTPYRGIDTFWYLWCYPGYSIEHLMGGLILTYGDYKEDIWLFFYWTPYRGIDTFPNCFTHYSLTIEPLIGGLRPIAHILVVHIQISIVYWTPYRGIDTTLREWGIRNEKWAIIFLGWTGEDNY